jgi:hypothetical protein
MMFPLAPFAYWSFDEWKKNKKMCQEIFDTGLGWDVTDFGSGDFKNIGRVLFTLRNGRVEMKEKYPKPYAQKVMMLREGQKSPVHFHKSKMEDIVNQGGGETVILLWKATKAGKLSNKPFTITVDGISRNIRTGGKVTLTNGESITLPQRTFHQYWAKKGRGSVLSIEVSSVNDDLNDNFWLKPATRFPEIVEDEQIKYLLASDYAQFS